MKGNNSFWQTISQLKKGYIILFFLVTFGVGTFAGSPFGKNTTDRVYDVLRTTGTRDEVVIIGIDDKSLQEFGAWPWNRSVFAQLQNVLTGSGVKVSVYDILFFEPRVGDADFQESLSLATKPVVLASKFENQTYLSSYLVTGSTTSRSALANVEPDTDGKVREYSQTVASGNGCTMSLAQTAFALVTSNKACGNPSGLFRYPSQITTYSLVDVVQNKIPENNLRGKAVFIGATSLGLEDTFMGLGGAKIPGVYVHASMFTSLLNNVEDKPVSRAVTLILIILVSVLASCCILASQSVYKQSALILGLLLTTIVTSVVIFEQGVILPLPWLIASILISGGYSTLIRFISERKQNEYIQSLFSKYVHKDVLRELIASGSDIKLGGERKPVTVLFSDIRGFTTLSESLSPEELTSTLNDYLSAMTPHILEEKGTIDKFIGDAIMAFWNAPLSVENHSLHAIYSALRMEKALQVLNAEKGYSLAIGIGVHTGSVVVGNVGGKDRVNYTILGDTVNLTSRLESLTKKYGVIVLTTEAVKEVVVDASLAWRKLDIITVAGKATPTTLYEVRNITDFQNSLIEKYENALSLYSEGAWDKAEEAFTKLSEEGDIPSSKMLARIPELRKKKEWDGVWRFDEK